MTKTTKCGFRVMLNPTTCEKLCSQTLIQGYHLIVLADLIMNFDCLFVINHSD